tara:strand:+ start:362 stop:1099 length:738 start_codon:yes stop_codon:yes gene_type:complete
MKRSASEIIRNLEGRIARLERQSDRTPKYKMREQQDLKSFIAFCTKYNLKRKGDFVFAKDMDSPVDLLNQLKNKFGSKGLKVGKNRDIYLTSFGEETLKASNPRLARLEGKTANKNEDIKIESYWYTGGPREDSRYLTLWETLGDLEDEFLEKLDELKRDIEEGDTEQGTNFDVLIDIGYGQVRINSGVDDGTDSYQAGCSFCLWSAFLAEGLDKVDYSTASKKLAAMLKSELSRFSPEVDIGKA